ncbi:MAG: PPC domain-containing DNA-binding protein [Candidatus Bathyarchaeia archaeon]
MKHVEGSTGKMVFVQLSQGEDLVKSIEKVVDARNISAGAFFAIGTLSEASFYFYRPKPSPITIKKPLEIVACSGSISPRGSKRRVHGHIDVTDSEFRSQGGHLLEGSIVDAMAFVVIFELVGADISELGL